jgi:membrane dipeptidase
VRIADLHADVLSKLLLHPGRSWQNASEGALFDATPERLRQGGVALQVFAIYLPEALPKTPDALFESAELFWSEVLTAKGVKLIRTGRDVEALKRDESRIGAILSLEGADGLQGLGWPLRLLHRLGLRLLGPTWNHANWACDGAMEPRAGGLTRAGKQLIEQCGKLGILVDVSHLSERGFWDVAELSRRPFFASHSNAKALKDHPRNLTNAQLQTLIEADGLIGLTFVPWFLTEREPATVTDILRHVEHVCELGGAGQIAFGSDFDGVERHVSGLEHPGLYPVLAEELLRRYPENLVNAFMGGNAFRFFEKNLMN